MKKIFVLIASLLLITSCSTATNTSLSGNISGLDAATKTVSLRGMGIKESVPISETGDFKFDVNIEKPGNYNLFVNKKVRLSVFLNKGYDLSLSADAANLSKSIKFTGDGGETNSYYRKASSAFNTFAKTKNQLYKLNKNDFAAQLSTIKTEIGDLSKDIDVDPLILEKVNASIEKSISTLEVQYKDVNKKTYNLTKGSESPEFLHYENYNGGTSSMSDFKGKYLYIDVWATWCGPCKAQIPALIKLEKEYRGKNIEFISVSTDKPNAHGKWKSMVKDKGLKGTQLYMGKNRSFMTDYGIRGIPRFLFIDPDGNIVNSKAPRPSQSAAVKKMFAEAGL